MGTIIIKVTGIFIIVIVDMLQNGIRIITIMNIMGMITTGMEGTMRSTRFTKIIPTFTALFVLMRIGSVIKLSNIIMMGTGTISMDDMFMRVTIKCFEAD